MATAGWLIAGGDGGLAAAFHRRNFPSTLLVWALFSSQKILQNFSDSHRIFRRMHEVLNIDKNKN